MRHAIEKMKKTPCRFSPDFFHSNRFRCTTENTYNKHKEEPICLAAVEADLKCGHFIDDDGFMMFVDRYGTILEWDPPGEDKPSNKFYSSEYNRDMVPETATGVIQVGK